MNPSVIKSTLFEEDCHDDDACEDRVVLDDESRRASLCVSRARRRKRFLFPPLSFGSGLGFHLMQLFRVFVSEGKSFEFP